MNDIRPIRVILDRSALESYAQGHVHVGNLFTEVADAGRVGVPAVALLEAHARSSGDKHAKALLDVLVTLGCVTVLELGADEATRIACAVPLAGGDISRAHAVWSANAHDALYLTTKPDEVKFLVPPGNVLQIPDENA